MPLRFQAPSTLTFSWCPGSGFLHTARLWAKDTAAMVDVPYNFTKQEMVFKNLVLSLVSIPYFSRKLETPCHPSYLRLLKMKASSLLRRDVKLTASSIGIYRSVKSTLYSEKLLSLLGGSDTTVSAQYAFFLAMVFYPGSYPYLLQSPSNLIVFFFSRSLGKGACRIGCCRGWRAITWIFRPTPSTIYQCYRYRSSSME